MSLLGERESLGLVTMTPGESLARPSSSDIQDTYTASNREGQLFLRLYILAYSIRQRICPIEVPGIDGPWMDT